MTIEELLEAMESIIAAAREDGDRDLTEEEVARYEELEGKLVNARRAKEVRSRHDAYTRPLTPDLHVNVAGTGEEERHERAFEQYLRTGNDEVMGEYRAQSTGTNTAGGYLVPAGFRQKLVERMKEFGGIQDAAETITTSEGNTLSYPTIDDTANVGEIVAEGGTFAAGADLVFGTRSLSAYKYMAGGAGNLPLKVSWELLQDSAFDVSSFVARRLGERIARVQAVHWATGTGTGQPQGLVTPIATSGAIGSNATGPTYAELLATINFLDPAYWSNARWVMNAGTLAKIQGQLDANGRPLMMSGDASLEGAPGRGSLLGFPVTIDPAMPSAAASAKFLAFGDIRAAYVIRRVKEVTLVTLNELYAANGQTGFMAWARADGAVQDVNAVVVRTAAV